MFSNLYPPVYSGSATHTARLAKELARRGHLPVVITARVDPASPEHEEVAGVPIYRLPALRLPRLPIALNFPWLSLTFTPGNLRRIRAILDRHTPDVLHLHNHMFDLALSAVLFHSSRRRPLVVTLHTMIKHSRALYNTLLFPADRVLLKHLVVRRAQAVICPDENIRVYAHEAFGLPNAPIVPYGIEVDPPPAGMVEALIRRHGLGGKRVILSLGHVHDIRNRKDLVAAMPQVLSAVPEAVLLIVGTEATPSTRQLAEELGVTGSVIFTGAVPHAEVAAFLALADLEAHWGNQDPPERTSLGIASLEAMSAGKVILAAANPDTYGPGLMRDGENLIITRPGDPAGLARTIIALLSDPARRAAIGERARQTIAEHFSWESVCARTLRVYEQTLAKVGQPVPEASAVEGGR
jgi:glycosyltransferase involved in cell wall biosynthesis